MYSTYEFTLKEGPKVKMENFRGTKSWRKILEGLKWKVSIFIGIKNIFNPQNINTFYDLFCLILTISISLETIKKILSTIKIIKTTLKNKIDNKFLFSNDFRKSII